jgi:nucleoside-diphosphate-sugar epimerase
MKIAVSNEQLIYIDDGDFKTSAVHVDDAARMYLLAAEKGSLGEVFNCTSSTDVTALQLAQAMGSILDLPVKSVKFEDALATYGKFLTDFLCAVNRASSAKAVKMLGWQPREIGILEDIRTGSYVAVAQELRKE